MCVVISLVFNSHLIKYAFLKITDSQFIINIIWSKLCGQNATNKIEKIKVDTYHRGMGSILVFGTIRRVREGFFASRYFADVRPFTRMRTKMCFEILKARVCFVATFVLKKNKKKKKKNFFFKKKKKFFF